MIKGKWRVDEAVDAAYLHFTDERREGIVAKTLSVCRDIHIDFDAEGRLYGIEVLSLGLLPKDYEK